MTKKNKKEDTQINSVDYLEIYEKKLDEYVYNINNGYKHEDLDKSKSLVEGMIKETRKYIDNIRKYEKTYSNMNNKSELETTSIKKLINNEKKQLADHIGLLEGLMEGRKKMVEKFLHTGLTTNLSASFQEKIKNKEQQTLSGSFAIKK